MKKISNAFRKMTLIQAEFVMAYGALAAMWGVYYVGCLCGVLAALVR